MWSACALPRLLYCGPSRTWAHWETRGLLHLGALGNPWLLHSSAASGGTWKQPIWQLAAFWLVGQGVWPTQWATQGSALISSLAPLLSGRPRVAARWPGLDPCRTSLPYNQLSYIAQAQQQAAAPQPQDSAVAPGRRAAHSERAARLSRELQEKLSRDPLIASQLEHWHASGPGAAPPAVPGAAQPLSVPSPPS